MNEAEIALAALAQKQATDPRVKSVADVLKRDHEAARAEIQKLAKPRNVELTAMAVGQLAAHNRLEKMTGADFDRAWLTEIIELHRDARGLYSRATRSADAEIKTLATLQATNLGSSEAREGIAGRGQIGGRAIITTTAIERRR